MRRPAYKLTLGLLALLLIFGAGRIQDLLNRDRERLGLTRVAPLENAPPILALTTQALGGFRGLIANALWVRAMDLQDQDKYFEMVQLADWITKLEPHFVQVWLVQAWNMAYNISVKFKDPADRWRWVQRGVELLRDEGLKYNPKETLIYRELSWFYQHKIGHNLDDAHMFYKVSLFNDMQSVLGNRPRDPELLNPQTDDARRRLEILTNRFKLLPARMKEADDKYGPFDWRLPEAHAVYWAMLGQDLAKKEDQMSLRRSIYQSMQMAFTRGAAVEDKIGGGFTLGPNLEIIANVSKSYEDMMAQDESTKDLPKTGHKNFLRRAVEYLYLENRRTEAVRWFNYLKEKYPDGVRPPTLSLDEYVVQQVTEAVGETDVDRNRAVIGGLLVNSYLSLISDEDEKADNLRKLAQAVWRRHQEGISGQNQRVGLPPFAEIDRLIRNQLLDPEQGLPDEAAARLRTLLNLPASTNAAPVVPLKP